MAPEMPKGSRLGTEPGGWPSARPVTGIYLPITMRPADLPTNPVLATLSALSQGGGPLTSPPPPFLLPLLGARCTPSSLHISRQASQSKKGDPHFTDEERRPLGPGPNPRVSPPGYVQALPPQRGLHWFRPRMDFCLHALVPGWCWWKWGTRDGVQGRGWT